MTWPTPAAEFLPNLRKSVRRESTLYSRQIKRGQGAYGEFGCELDLSRESSRGNGALLQLDKHGMLLHTTAVNGRTMPGSGIQRYNDYGAMSTPQDSNT